MVLLVVGMCLLPFCMPRCKDEWIICAKCSELKAIVPAQGI